MASLDNLTDLEADTDPKYPTAAVNLSEFIDQLQETFYRVPKELRRAITLAVYVKEEDGSLQCEATLPTEVLDRINEVAKSISEAEEG